MIYASLAELRAEPDVPAGATDAELTSAIEKAEDQLDAWLGLWPVLEDGPSAGRKIAEADVAAWQWAKLKRATVRLAAHLNRDPNVLTPPAWGRVKGPDFEKSDPRAGVTHRIPDVLAPLQASGLRVLGARAAAG